jgi:uncharacterized protein (DUF58 family)
VTNASRTSSGPRSPLDPEVLDKLAGLELKARAIVEGYVSGLHRSPFRGFSVEFAEHREYVPGDDIRFLDWKVFGRSDRLYIKRYEEETNLEAVVVLDVSASMTYRGDGVEHSKLDYARWAAAAIAYLVTQQQDVVGLRLFDDAVRKAIPPGNNPVHLRNLIAALDQAQPTGTTGVGRALKEVGESLERRGLVLLFSDLLDDPQAIAAGLKQIRHRGHEMVLFHVLDPDELHFPFERLTRFVGLEGGPEVIGDPEALRRGYLDEVEAFQKTVRRACHANRIDFVPLETSESLGTTLSAYLAKREARRRA